MLEGEVDLLIEKTEYLLELLREHRGVKPVRRKSEDASRRGQPRRHPAVPRAGRKSADWHFGRR
jgi:hypothetical protein